MTARELSTFGVKVSHLAALIPKLDALDSLSSTSKMQSSDDASHSPSPKPAKVEPTDTEHLGWGPKTADPGPDRFYPSKTFHETIDVDLQLDLSQHEALYQVVENNQAAFGFDGRLGHLKSEIHIELIPGTKPISMPPYYASLAKHKAIDKQIDLWLLQGVIEES